MPEPGHRWIKAPKGGKNVEKVRYMISDAANIVNVESHVLRYWEEELELQIPRNEMGHRYYTEDNIAQFRKIKEWKEQGYQLKAIRILIHNGEVPKEELQEMEQQHTRTTFPSYGVTAVEQGESMTMGKGHIVPQMQNNVPSNTVKLEQFQSMMLTIVKRAVEENNQALGREVGGQLEEHVLKEMNYLMREQDEAEEERFRKLDAALRASPKGKSLRKEKAEKAEKEKKLFGKNRKLNPNLTA